MSITSSLLRFGLWLNGVTGDEANRIIYRYETGKLAPRSADLAAALQDLFTVQRTMEFMERNSKYIEPDKIAHERELRDWARARVECVRTRMEAWRARYGDEHDI